MRSPSPRKGRRSEKVSHLAGPGEQVQLDIRISQTIVVHWLQALQREQGKQESGGQRDAGQAGGAH